MQKEKYGKKNQSAVLSMTKRTKMLAKIHILSVHRNSTRENEKEKRREIKSFLNDLTVNVVRLYACSSLYLALSPARYLYVCVLLFTVMSVTTMSTSTTFTAERN